MGRLVGVALSAAMVLAIVGVAFRVKFTRNLMMGGELVSTLKLPA